MTFANSGLPSRPQLRPGPTTVFANSMTYAHRQNVGSNRRSATSLLAPRTRMSTRAKRSVRMAVPAGAGSVTKEGGDVSFRSILVLVWAFATVWWSIFTPPGKTFAARVLLFQPLWILRVFRQDENWIQDLFLVLVSHAGWSIWTGVWDLTSLYDYASINFEDDEAVIYVKVFAMLGLCGVLAGTIVHRDSQLSEEEKTSHPAAHERTIDEHPLPPLLIPSQTTHSRLFPKKNSFSYSYLFVGIPVGLNGRISKALSVDGTPTAWFNVKASDYLYRGDEHLALGEKLKSYLRTQGVTDRDYSFAYLVTAPRFLGYGFNPVSFWYIYDADACLMYMILEVNNTFDERRLYLLRRRHPGDKSDDDDDAIDSARNTLLFSESWEKDFHVSPFNSRKGRYSLCAVDPLASYQETRQVCVDNTIVLRSSKEHPKLVARVFSSSSPVSALTISATQLITFIMRWWWVGFLTFPRIIYQAARLFFRAKLSVFYRPEVTPASIGRSYTPEEFALELLFAAFLTKAVESSASPLRVIYRAAHPPTPKPNFLDSETTLYSPDFTYEEAHSRTLTLAILSPAFYSRFVHYAHASEAFDREALNPEPKNRTLTLSPPSLLPVLLDAMHAITPSSTPTHTQNSLEKLRWRALYSLRCPPAAPAYPTTTLSTPTTPTDIRSLPPSPLDLLLQLRTSTLTTSPKAPSTQISASSYRRICIQLFLTQRFALGLPALISALDILLRGFMVLAAVLYACDSDVFDVLRPRPHGWDDWVSAGALLGLINLVHFWELCKG